MRVEPTEKQIENSILCYLEHLPECFAWANDSVGIYDKEKGLFRKSKNRFHINGVSDILCGFNGRLLVIEVKTPKEYKYLMNRYDEIKSGYYTKNIKKKDHLKDQIIFIENVRRNGGIAFFAHSIESVKSELAKVAKNSMEQGVV